MSVATDQIEMNSSTDQSNTNTSMNENNSSVSISSSDLDVEAEVQDLNSENTFVPIKSDENKVNETSTNTASNNNHNDEQTSHYSGTTDMTEDSDEGIFDLNNLPETISILNAENGITIYLVGTSHFSRQSHQDVRRIIRTVKPRIVLLELCAKRLDLLSMDEKAFMKEATSFDSTKMLQLLRQHGFIHTLFKFVTCRVTSDLSLAPAGEFRNAYLEAGKIPDCTVVLGDRPIDITLIRALNALTLWQKIKMAYHCLFDCSMSHYNEEELEQFKKKDMLEGFIEELSREFPGLSKVMVEERDSFLAFSLWRASKNVEPGSNIVGVVGLGHSAGIQSKWNNASNIVLSELLKIPERKPSITIKIIKYTIYGAMAYGIYRYVIPKTMKQWATNTIKALFAY